MTSNQNSKPANQLTKKQAKTFSQFKRKLADNLPTFRIEWVLPVKANIIVLHLESDKRTYRNSIKASKLATEVEDETGVTIIFR